MTIRAIVWCPWLLCVWGGKSTVTDEELKATVLKDDYSCKNFCQVHYYTYTAHLVVFSNNTALAEEFPGAAIMKSPLESLPNELQYTGDRAPLSNIDGWISLRHEHNWPGDGMCELDSES